METHACYLTHNDNIKTFDDVARHVKLEEDRLLTEKHIQEAFMSENKLRGAQDFGCNKGKGKGLQQGKGRKEASYSGQKCKRRKRDSKKGKNKNCFNYGKLGHFARDCTNLKVMFDHNRLINIYVNSCLMLVETIPFWIVDSTTIEHVARDRISFVEFNRILKGSRCINVENNASVAVLGICTYKLKLQKVAHFYLHDVLYALKVQRNLISMLVLLEIGFSIIFENGCVKILLDNIYYGSGYLLNDFMVLDTINVFVNDYTSKLLVIPVLLMIIIVSFGMLDKDTLGKTV